MHARRLTRSALYAFVRADEEGAAAQSATMTRCVIVSRLRADGAGQAVDSTADKASAGAAPRLASSRAGTIVTRSTTRGDNQWGGTDFFFALRRGPTFRRGGSACLDTADHCCHGAHSSGVEPVVLPACGARIQHPGGSLWTTPRNEPRVGADASAVEKGPSMTAKPHQLEACLQACLAKQSSGSRSVHEASQSRGAARLHRAANVVICIAACRTVTRRS
jgi:hypothetical protein